MAFSYTVKHNMNSAFVRKHRQGRHVVQLYNACTGTLGYFCKLCCCSVMFLHVAS